MNFEEFLETVSEDNIIETIFNKNLELSNLRRGQLEDKKHLEKSINNLKNKKSNIMNNTDWKELGITNADGRNAYINEEINEEQQEIDDFNYIIKLHDIDISSLKRDLRLCDHIISKYDSLIIDQPVNNVNVPVCDTDFTTADKHEPVNLIGDPKAKEYIIQAKQYLSNNKEKVTVEKIKDLALYDLEDPESAINDESFNRIIKQLHIEGVGL